MVNKIRGGKYTKKFPQKQSDTVNVGGSAAALKLRNHALSIYNQFLKQHLVIF